MSIAEITSSVKSSVVHGYDFAKAELRNFYGHTVTFLRNAPRSHTLGTIGVLSGAVTFTAYTVSRKIATAILPYKLISETNNQEVEGKLRSFSRHLLCFVPTAGAVAGANYLFLNAMGLTAVVSTPVFLAIGGGVIAGLGLVACKNYFENKALENAIKQAEEDKTALQAQIQENNTPQTQEVPVIAVPLEDEAVVVETPANTETVVEVPTADVPAPVTDTLIAE